jgi:hypothetical protein
MIRFSTRLQYLAERQDLHPKRLPPGWFADLAPGILEDPEHHVTGKSAATCPGMRSLFNLAVVVPLWCDIRLTRGQRIDEEFHPHPDGRWIMPTYAPEFFGLEYHAVEQVGPDFPGAYGLEILPKPVSPWLLELPPGWSCLVMPALLHTRRLPFEPIPGIFNSDNWHQTNMPCRFTREPELETSIFAGTPFAYYLPFNRHEDPGELVVDLIEDQAEWERIHSEPSACPMSKHLVTRYGRPGSQ